MKGEILLVTFVIFGFLLLSMTVVQMIISEFVQKDTKYIYYTFVTILIVFFIFVLAAMLSL